MKHPLLPLILLPLLLLPASARRQDAPEWYPDARKAFPADRFLTQAGAGDSADRARTDAAGALARYFKTSVDASLRTTMTAISTERGAGEETRVVDDVTLSSNVELFALELTEPYRDKKDRKWHCVAYIEREAAWRQYRPRVESLRDVAAGFRARAEREEEPFERVALYRKAWGASLDFLESLEFARIIYPRAEAEFAKDRERAAEIPSLIGAEAANLTVRVESKGDWGGTVEQGAKRGLERAGFRVVQGAGANYTATLRVEPNATGGDPLAVLPSATLSVTGRGGRGIASVQAALEEKTVAYTLETAQKKSYPRLSAKLEEELGKLSK